MKTPLSLSLSATHPVFSLLLFSFLLFLFDPLFSSFFFFLHWTHSSLPSLFSSPFLSLRSKLQFFNHLSLLPSDLLSSCPANPALYNHHKSPLSPFHGKLRRRTPSITSPCSPVLHRHIPMLQLWLRNQFQHHRSSQLNSSHPSQHLSSLKLSPLLRLPKLQTTKIATLRTHLKKLRTIKS